MGRLRAYGNAVDAEATTHFIEAFDASIPVRLSSPSILTTDSDQLKGPFA